MQTLIETSKARKIIGVSRDVMAGLLQSGKLKAVVLGTKKARARFVSAKSLEDFIRENGSREKGV